MRSYRRVKSDEIRIGNKIIFPKRENFNWAHSFSLISLVLFFAIGMFIVAYAWEISEAYGLFSIMSYFFITTILFSTTLSLSKEMISYDSRGKNVIDRDIGSRKKKNRQERLNVKGKKMRRGDRKRVGKITEEFLGGG